MPKLESRITNHESRAVGFTLIELLVAISIVSIVFGVILTSAAAIAKNSRDTQRKADLKNIQSALQQYYADQNFFPENAFVLSSAGSLTSSKGNFTTPLPSPVKTYLSILPKDPTSGTITPYLYNAFTSSNLSTPCSNVNDSTTQCHYYCLFAKLENPPSVSGTCGTPPADYNWIVTAN